MDPVPGRDNVFSRGPTPPPHQQSQFAVPQSSEQSISNPSTMREPGPTATSTLESLFHNLSAPAPPQSNPQPPAPMSSNPFASPQDVPHSGPATPASMAAGSVSSSHSVPTNPTTERQNALLTLLGAVTSPPTTIQAMPLMGPAAPPQQVPTPPGSAPRAPPSSNESQGKMLLEQLMSGAPKYTNEQAPSSYPLPGSGGPSPTYLPSLSDTQSHQQGDYYGGDASSYTSLEPAANEVPQSQTSSQRPPSPGRRSMFDFVSPFDALTSPPATQQPKRKPIPPPAPSVPTSGTDDSSWTAISQDPKRKSVENLIDQLTRGQAPLPPPNQSVTAQFDPYAPTEEASPQIDFGQSRAPRPLPPQPSHPSPNSSARASPPKYSTQQQQQPQRQQARRSMESPIGPPGNQAQFQISQRDKEGSPIPSGIRHPSLEPRGKVAPPKNRNPQNIQQQTIIFDVSQPLEEIQAPHESVKSTAIALVKVDSTFLPGTTIGATHWVAYAMTKGRVRVISRSSGDRTLLQLPSLFPSSVAVSDMSVHGDRLAGVTSDGGFVVWELPNVIRDDVLGQIVLCVLPSNDMNPLHAVKWHPQHSQLVAVASETNLYLINIHDAHQMFGGEPIPQSELHRVASIFATPSPIIAFDFDVRRGAIATISEDSTLTIWRITDKVPFWSNKIAGDDMPSSLTFVDGGLVVGRKNGTVFQLLPAMSRTVLSTIKFVNGQVEDPDMFGHANYDSRIQTLWVANNRRDSMIAFKLNFDVSTPSPGGDEMRNAYFDQVVEFVGPKPTIHFVILTADADPTGAEAHAACVAAKVPPGDLALVAFSVHSTGVDQILIRREWFEGATANAQTKFPMYNPQATGPGRRVQNQNQVVQPQIQVMPQTAAPVQLQRPKSPPLEDAEGTDSKDEGRGSEGKGKGKGRSVGWKNGEEVGNAKEKEKEKERDAKAKVADTTAVTSESPVTVALTKELKKVEENLHTRIGRTIGKELDKQHQRLEDARANEQAADFVRQEKILKLISTELTKNTTRVVEMAVKTEVLNSVLPALENITKTEVKAALNNQISKGLADSMKQNLPNEIERLLMRPDVSTHIARTFSSTVTPLVERQVKETITKSLIPAYTQQSSAMHQELSREIHSEILNLKKEVITWQSEALRGQESLIRELEQSVRLLSDQVKYLTMNTGPSHVNIPIPTRTSPVHQLSGHQAQSSMPQILRHQNMPPVAQQPSYAPSHGPFPQQSQQPPQQPPAASAHGPWFSSNIAAPQASHPAAPPPMPSQQSMSRTPPTMGPPTEEWDDTYLAVLGMQDNRQLRELLGRSNPEAVMPMNGAGPLSQAVVLTLVHRLTAIIGETPPVDESFKSSLWWLQRAASVLNTSDPLISPYIGRVLPSVQQMLNTTKQRLAIIPGAPLVDTARTISDLQDMLARKPM